MSGATGAESLSSIPTTALRGLSNCRKSMDIDFEGILRTYVTESEEHLVRMEESLIGLETYPDDQKFLEAIFRGAHTIKGNAAGLGFPKVSEFAHAFEELLQRLRNHVLPVTKETISVLLRSVDALRQMIPSAIAGAKELEPEHQALLAQLIDRNAPPAERQPPPPQNTNPSRQPARRRREDFQALVERADTVRVDIRKLDRMLNLAGEIAVAH